MAQAETLPTSLDKLDISKGSKQPPKPKADIADCWEDEAGSDVEVTATKPPTLPLTPSASDSPGPPPPTPISPSVASARNGPPANLSPYGFDGTTDSPSSSGAATPVRRSAGNSEEKRPEKSTAVASRLIAAGLGQKAPRRTKEQREYDQAMRIQEKKRRDAAKEEDKRKAEEREKAKRDMWGD